MMQFGEFTLDEKQARLLRQQEEISIEPKLFELLLLFVNQPNTIISRQIILDNLWADSLITDNSINKLIANLRKVLADEPKNPRYIQTVPKRGYRLICEVSLIESFNSTVRNPVMADEIGEVNNSIEKSPKSRFQIVTAITVMFALLCCLFLWQVFSGNEITSNNLYTMELTRAHGAEESARMHPDNTHLYYLKKDSDNTTHQLWIKNIHSAKTKQIDSAKTSMSKIIAVIAGLNSDTTNLFYLDKRQDSCGVYKALIIKSSHVKQTEKLFDCNNKRIKDIDYHVSDKVIYYTAQPQNFWPNQIYAFNLASQKHSFVTQDEPTGWGHHNIDISPDGNKLLIMTTNGDHKTQLLVLNLLNNEITQGLKFDYPVTEAIWHHDSEQIYYYAPLAHQIIKSDLNGNDATTVVSVSENLSSQMSLFPDGKNLLFSTEQKNFGNRWLVAPTTVSDIDNSTVDEFNPALFHHSPQYLFISQRSGRKQLYLGHFDANQAQIVTNFSLPLELGYIAMSFDDQSVLLSVNNKVYLLPISDLNETSSLTTLKQEHLIFTSEQPIIWLDWLTASGVAITTVKNGIPELMVVNLFDNKIQQLKGKWAYGLTDSQHLEYNYLIEQQTNILYRTESLTFGDESVISPHKLTSTQITLPNDFFHVKIDANTLYYGSNESNNVYLNAVPLDKIDKGSKYLLNDFNGYDVSNVKIMLSDLESLEGDVHRTMY